MTTKEWAGRLRHLAEQQGYSLPRLAAEVPMSTSSLYHLAAGRRFPSMWVAEALARILDAPYLAEAMLERRKKACTVCGATFIDQGNKRNAVSCGDVCQRTLRARRNQASRMQSNAHAAMIAKRRLERYSAAVVAFCRSCEPEGICRNGSCELRTVSPLPLSVRRTA